MAFTIKDVRFTTRRAGNGEPFIYPRLLRDRSLLPKIAVAIEYFEGLVGRERHEVDGELFVNFFGDHKLARSMVAALGTTYRFRSRRIDDVVSKVSARRLARQGITAPKMLRLALFDDVNTRRCGFTAIGQREAACNDLAVRLKVRPAEVERVLYLDLDEHAVLHRAGARALPEDVAAQFNLGVLDTLLRQAEYIELHLAGATPVSKATVTGVCTAYGVTVAPTDSNAVRLLGRQDALGNWSRHGRRLARVTMELLERGQAALQDGLAMLALPNRRVQLRLTPELLTMLSAPDRGPADWQDDLTVHDDILAIVSTAVHRRPGTWALRRLPDPRASVAGVVLADLGLRQGDRQIAVCAVRSAAHAFRLAQRNIGATALPRVFVGPGDILEPLRATGATCIAAERFDVPTLEAALGPCPPPTVPRRQSRPATAPIEQRP